MKRKLSILCLIFLFMGCSSVQRRPWTGTDKALFGAACVADAYDFCTTKRILDDDGHMKKGWRFLYLGEDKPSTELLAISKVAQLGIAYVVLDRVPSEWRKCALLFMTGTWTYYAVDNERKE